MNKKCVVASGQGRGGMMISRLGTGYILFMLPLGFITSTLNTLVDFFSFSCLFHRIELYEIPAQNKPILDLNYST